MQEDFLYYLWQHKLLYADRIQLTNGESIRILHPGFRNNESGPDFANARLELNGLQWAGNVEIHVRSSDWKRHGHDSDMAYDNILLHVVHEHDAEVYRRDGSPIPTLEMKNRYPLRYLEHYEQLMQAPSTFVACASQLHDVPEIQRSTWTERLMIERLEQRTSGLRTILQESKGHWTQVLYRMLGRGFGFKVNAVPFEWLTQVVPYTLLQRHRERSEESEALLFGQAGLLPQHGGDPYTRRLAQQYSFQKSTYRLHALPEHLWKFGGLRPYNFPTLRISQFASLFRHNPNIQEHIVHAIAVNDVCAALEVQASDYWFHHYRFGVACTPVRKSLGQAGIRHLLLNAVIPYLFFFGKQQHLPVLCDKALYWMQSIPPESNSILQAWHQHGWKARYAGEAQALLQLKKHYCDLKKCVTCHIGKHLLKQV